MSVAGFQGQESVLESGPGIGAWNRGLVQQTIRMPRQAIRDLVTEQIVDLSAESVHLLLQFGHGGFKLGNAVFLTGFVAGIA